MRETATDQLTGELREAILAGRLRAGDKLPSSRDLARERNCARITVVQTYERLVAEGYLETRRGLGTYVAELRVNPQEGRDALQALPLSSWSARLTQPAPKTPPLAVDFQPGLPARHLFPITAWRRALARAGDAVASDLWQADYLQGYPPLRAAIAAFVRQTRGVVASADDIVIVSGSQQALDLIARVLLDPGDTVALEDPIYPGAFASFSAHGARLQPLPVDEEGADIASLQGDARLIFLTPAHQFPLGPALSLRRRLLLKQWLTTHRALVIEDDYDTELHYGPDPGPALQSLSPQRVVYVGTFSKTLFPGLRLAYMAVPREIRAEVLRTKAVVDRQSPLLLQAAVADFMQQGHWLRHLSRIRKAYAAQQAALREALAGLSAHGQTATEAGPGLHLIFWLKRCKAEDVARAAADVGLGVYPLQPYAIEANLQDALLLGFAGLEPAAIRCGVKLLGDVLAGL